jgi:hypothetical protein
MNTNSLPPVHGASGEPRSVARDGERAALALRAVHDMFRATPDDEARAWARFESRRRRARRSWPLFLMGAVAAAGAIALVIARSGANIEQASGPASGSETGDSRRAVEPRAPAPAALPPGSSILPGGLRAQLKSGGRATWVPKSQASGHVVLEHGTLQVDADAPVDVRVASLRVDASAGRFEITSRDGGVDVRVEKGEVAVWSSVRLIRRVVAGERWSSVDAADAPVQETPAPALARGSPTHGHRSERPVATPPESPDVPATAPPEPRDCLRLARDGVTDAAITCFEAQAAQPGLTGEIALLELARIRRDVKGDFAGAERLLAEHRRRFPHSALAAEARTIHVELLLGLGHPAEALDEAGRLTGPEALFWRAVSLEKLDRRAEAAQAFDDYLRRDGIERRAEAARRRRELGP